MTGRRTSRDELARTIARVGGRGTDGTDGRRLIGSQGDAVREPDEARIDAFRNPMDDIGQMIYGEKSGAPAKLTAPPSATVVLGATGPDVDGKFRPEWVAGGAGSGSGGLYWSFLWDVDGAGGWGFVEETIAGQTYPILEQFATE